MNVIPIPIIGMNTNTKEITENERKYKRQKCGHYGEHFISPSVVGLPCFFRVFDIDDFCTKKTHKFSLFYWLYWMFLPKFATCINQTL